MENVSERQRHRWHVFAVNPLCDHSRATAQTRGSGFSLIFLEDGQERGHQAELQRPPCVHKPEDTILRNAQKLKMNI